MKVYNAIFQELESFGFLFGKILKFITMAIT